MKNFYLVVGLLGAGKDSLINAVQKTIPMKLLKSYTTRPPRYNGEDTHTFINKEEYDFQELEITDKKGTKYKAAICLCVKKWSVKNETT